ncbi:phosphatidylserine decarboxylase-domain-containing protein [Auriculariales sp. MPI-PUGE-AT-0066]|nr:phosphatidylserine decarboxylase-domain-containing protein [Auriculariales sp. MPI-PUGE-AT-0066]
MPYTPIVQRLVDWLESDSEHMTAMKASFTAARASGVAQFTEYNIRKLEDYLHYLDGYVNWVPTETHDGAERWPVKQWQNPIDPLGGEPKRFITRWLIEYAQAMGSWMDKPESLTKESIQTFYDAKRYHMESYPVPEGGWNNFNEFFSRHINLDLRPIAGPNDDRIIVSPADCTFDGIWDVTEHGANVNTFTAKGIPWKISKLIDDAGLGPQFAGGKFTHSFLNANNYHRQHAPVSGQVVEAKVIPGICYLQVVLQEGENGPVVGPHRHMRDRNDSVIPASKRPMAILDAPDWPGYQFMQARGLILIDNPLLGLVAVLPIGMAQVSSVKLSVQSGQYVQKGDEISWFEFGGSDIIMVFQKKAKVKFLQDPNVFYEVRSAAAVGGDWVP